MKDLNDHIIQRISTFISENNLSWGSLAGKIGIHRQNIYGYRDKKVKVPMDMLNLISDRFKVPMTYWFDESTNDIKKNHIEEEHIPYQSQKEEEMKEMINILKDQLSEKDGQIKFLQKQIDIAQGSEGNDSKSKQAG